jgi:hypothetical protein
MSKKKAADIGKLVDAQAKGRKVVSVKTDSKAVGGEALDTRTSKQKAWLCTN